MMVRPILDVITEGVITPTVWHVSKEWHGMNGSLEAVEHNLVLDLVRQFQKYLMFVEHGPIRISSAIMQCRSKQR